jgi:hypothetical protein
MARKRKKVDSEEAVEKITSKPVAKLTKSQKIGFERELRRYVKKTGGFRKNLPEKEKETALGLMKILERKSPAWDKKIIVPGYDKPTCANMVIV